MSDPKISLLHRMMRHGERRPAARREGEPLEKYAGRLAAWIEGAVGLAMDAGRLLDAIHDCPPEGMRADVWEAERAARLGERP